jgi:hypothetical protein
MPVEDPRSITEKRAFMLRDFERGVLMRISVNKKEYKANTCKQERVWKKILVRKAERKGECVQARKSVKLLLSK